jgi:hypothetical protein
MTPGSYMASIDFKDAYYSVKMDPNCKKFLRFIFEGKKYQYTCLPNGLNTGPRKFTKVTKVLFAHLRLKKLHLNTSYIDDSFLCGTNIEDCRQNVLDTVETSQRAGFVVHPDKFVFLPTYIIIYLGFILNSLEMTIKLTSEKKQKIKTMITKAIENRCMKLQQLAELVGNLVSTFPAMRYGRLYYRLIDNEKNAGLKVHKGNFQRKLTLSENSVRDLKWWQENVEKEWASAYIPIPNITVQTDACNYGWGGMFDQRKNNGYLKESEKDYHINAKELLAVLFTLTTFGDERSNVVLKIMSDNTTTVAYINQQWKTRCNQIARQIWLWAIERNIWLIATLFRRNKTQRLMNSVENYTPTSNGS